MSEFDAKKYLKQLEKTLRVKELESFYVMCDRSDFKPMRYDTPRDLMNMFAEKIQYYRGKRVAYISLFTNVKGLKTNELVFSIKIVVYRIKDNGRLDQDYVRGLLVNYQPDDFERRKFRLKDVEKFMRICADEILNTETLNGNWYKNIIKMLKKRGVDFEED